jgi:hypothetical protein
LYDVPVRVEHGFFLFVALGILIHQRGVARQNKAEDRLSQQIFGDRRKRCVSG